MFKKLAVLCLYMFVIAGCGSGGGTGGASNLKLEISGLTTTTIEPGTTATGTVTVTADALGLNEVDVTIKTSDVDLIGSANKTNALGVASFSLTSNSNVTVHKTVQVWAELDGAKSNVVTIELNSISESSSFELTIANSVDYPTRSVPVGTPSTLSGVVVAGNQVRFLAPNGIVPPAGTPVTLTVDRIDAWVPGDEVTINGVSFSGTVPTQSAIVTTTNTDGIALIPTYFTIYVPPAPAIDGQSSPHTYVVYWRATVTYNGLVYSKVATTTVTTSTTATAAP
jgi:hypothetical protein